MRIRSDRRTPFPRILARFNRRIANPVVRLVAGWLPPLAIIQHHGRRTGRAFATPVVAFRTADGLVVGVLYGEVSDWVRNVQAAGGAQVKRRAVLSDYRHPRLVSREAGLSLVPLLLRGPFRALKVRSFLELTANDVGDQNRK